jgi:gluconate 5-dehydrogenase
MYTAPSFSLDGKLALVTGASRGIGRALAEGLAASGARVVLAGRDAGALAAVEQSILDAGHRCLVQVLDVGVIGDLAPAVAALEARLGPFDILINNAGVEEVRASLEVDEALWDRLLGTNLQAAFFLAQAVARSMPPGGSIVNLCSILSEVGLGGSAAYAASKTGLVGLTRSLAAEWAGRGIRVNGIGPGYFHTDMTEIFYANPDWQKAMLPKIPLGRFGRLEDLIGAAVFLCSDAASYLTGQVIYVDGGFLAAM